MRAGSTKNASHMKLHLHVWVQLVAIETCVVQRGLNTKIHLTVDICCANTIL